MAARVTCSATPSRSASAATSLLQSGADVEAVVDRRRRGDRGGRAGRRRPLAGPRGRRRRPGASGRPRAGRSRSWCVGEPRSPIVGPRAGRPSSVGRYTAPWPWPSRAKSPSLTRRRRQERTCSRTAGRPRPPRKASAARIDPSWRATPSTSMRVGRSRRRRCRRRPAGGERRRRDRIGRRSLPGRFPHDRQSRRPFLARCQSSSAGDRPAGAGGGMFVPPRGVSLRKVTACDRRAHEPRMPAAVIALGWLAGSIRSRTSRRGSGPTSTCGTSAADRVGHGAVRGRGVRTAGGRRGVRRRQGRRRSAASRADRPVLAVAAIAWVAGHNWSPWLRGAGGGASGRWARCWSRAGRAPVVCWRSAWPPGACAARPGSAASSPTLPWCPSWRGRVGGPACRRRRHGRCAAGQAHDRQSPSGAADRGGVPSSAPVSMTGTPGGTATRADRSGPSGLR